MLNGTVISMFFRQSLLSLSLFFSFFFLVPFCKLYIPLFYFSMYFDYIRIPFWEISIGIGRSLLDARTRRKEEEEKRNEFACESRGLYI